MMLRMPSAVIQAANRVRLFDRFLQRRRQGKVRGFRQKKQYEEGRWDVDLTQG